MRRFQVVGTNGQSTVVGALDWMLALSKAVTKMQLKVDAWVTDQPEEGIIRATDPRTGNSWLIALVDTGISAHLRTREDATQDLTSAEAAPEDLAEKIFDATFELSNTQDEAEAAQCALEILQALVGCQAGSVALGGINDANLKFVAATGPAANKIIGKTVPFGQGLIGVAFDLTVPVVAHDVDKDERHLPGYDDQTGFKTQAVACVPIQTEGTYFGVVELLNPKDKFQTWHIDACEGIASALASRLAGW